MPQLGNRCDSCREDRTPGKSSFYLFGLNTGIAFQIQDDLIDLLTPAEKSGKDRASI